MTFNTLTVDTEGSLGRLTLNRPECLNALSHEVLRELADAARWFDDRPEVLVVIVSGAGRAFSAGADLSDGVASSELPASDWVARREIGYLGSRMAQTLESMRAVTVAALHGYVIGGGVVIATACDFRYAAEGTLFSIPEVELGIPLTWGGIPRLVRDIGALKTKELVMSCRQFDAQEAHALGLINEVVEADELSQHVDSVARELAAKPSVPMLQTKAHVNAHANALAVTAYPDGDLIVGTRADAESAQATADYAEKIRMRKEST